MSQETWAQGEANIWYFGNNAGIDFNSGTPVALDDSAMTTLEGCSTISDASGSLLFYTDGITVYDRSHNIMQNGTGLLGSSSSANSSVVIPRPGNPNIYYIFTTDDEFMGNNGLNYSEVNMTLNGGFGAVTANKNILLETNTTEHLSAVRHGTDGSIWVAAHKLNSNQIVVFNVTNTGVNMTPVTSNVGWSLSGSVGLYKFSPNGSFLGMTSFVDTEGLALFDFNNNTGVVSGFKAIKSFMTPSTLDYGGYGLEFSADSNVLYLDSDADLFQYDLSINTEAAIVASEFLVGATGSGTALQLGPDEKIYKVDDNFLDVINNPEVLGAGSNFVASAVPLAPGTTGVFGLPSYIQSFFINGTIDAANLCLGDTTEFTFSEVVDSVTWNFGDPTSGASNTSTAVAPTHVLQALVPLPLLQM